MSEDRSELACESDFINHRAAPNLLSVLKDLQNEWTHRRTQRYEVRKRHDEDTLRVTRRCLAARPEIAADWLARPAGRSLAKKTPSGSGYLSRKTPSLHFSILVAKPRQLETDQQVAYILVAVPLTCENLPPRVFVLSSHRNSLCREIFQEHRPQQRWITSNVEQHLRCRFSLSRRPFEFKRN